MKKKIGRPADAPEQLARAAKKRANEFTQPIVDGTKGHGDKKRLADTLGKKVGQAVTRHLVERWTQADPERRVMPSLGNGLLLREAFDKQAAKKHNMKRKEAGKQNEHAQKTPRT